MKVVTQFWPFCRKTVNVRDCLHRRPVRQCFQCPDQCARWCCRALKLPWCLGLSMSFLRLVSQGMPDMLCNQVLNTISTNTTQNKSLLHYYFMAVYHRGQIDGRIPSGMAVIAYQSTGIGKHCEQEPVKLIRHQKLAQSTDLLQKGSILSNACLCFGSRLHDRSELDALSAGRAFCRGAALIRFANHSYSAQTVRTTS